MYQSLLFTALALCLTLTACTPAEHHNEAEKPRPAVMVRPQIADAQQDVYPGEIHARYESALAFRIGGKIKRRLADVGDRVTRGQPLAELSAEDLQLQLDSAQAHLNSAAAEHRLARSELERYRKLRERQLVSSSQLDAVQTRYDASSAQLKQARAQLQVAQNQKDYAVLTAPQAGVIAQRLAEAGQVVTAGQAIFALAADGEREVRIDLPEQGIDRFEVGQELALELWSQPGQLFPARIRELSPAADRTSRTFEARVAFDNDIVGAELGQSARVFANTSTSTRRLAVPMSAVTADSEQPYVWVLDPLQQTLHKTPITIGAYGEEQVPVLAGLQPNDWIVAAGTHLLRDGQAVRPVDRMNRPIDLDRSIAQEL